MNNKATEKNAKIVASKTLGADELDQVKGGAVYIKFDGVDGECSVAPRPVGGISAAPRRRSN